MCWSAIPTALNGRTSHAVTVNSITLAPSSSHFCNKHKQRLLTINNIFDTPYNRVNRSSRNKGTQYSAMACQSIQLSDHLQLNYIVSSSASEASCVPNLIQYSLHKPVKMHLLAQHTLRCTVPILTWAISLKNDVMLSFHTPVCSLA